MRIRTVDGRRVEPKLLKSLYWGDAARGLTIAGCVLALVCASVVRAMMRNLLQDVGFGLRSLRKSPGFAITAIVTLALGVGANTAIFSVTNAVLLRPHNFPDLGRLVDLREVVRGRAGQQTRLAAGDVGDLSGRHDLFQDLAAYQFREVSLGRMGDAEAATSFAVTPNMFGVLGVAPAFGRLFSTDSAQVGSDHEVLLSYNYWQRRFGGDRSVVGSTVFLDGHDATIAGVMPQGMNYPAGVEVWTPLALTPEAKADRTKESLYVVARLATGVSIDAARAALEATAGQLQREFPATNAVRSYSLIRLREEQYSETAPLLLMLQAGALFVLLLACANLGVLTLIRLVSRERELAVRTALGASQTRLLQLFVGEAVLFCTLAGAAAVAASVWSVNTIRSSLAPNYTKWVAGWDSMHVDGNVLAAAIVAVAAVVVLLGITAVVYASRIDPNPALKEGGRSGTSRRHHALRNALVMMQIAVALVLLVGAGLVITAFGRMQDIFSAFDPAHVLRFSVSLPESRYTASQVVQFYDNLASHLESMRGASDVGVITNNPASNVENPQTQFTIAGNEALSAAEVPIAERQVANEGVFNVLHIPVIDGRGLLPSDGPNSPKVTVISQAMAKRYWPRGSAVGQRIKLGTTNADAPWIMIVGVVGDVQLNWFQAVPGAVIYLPYSQTAPRRMTFLMRTTDDPANHRSEVRQELAKVDPMLTLGEVNPYTVEVDDSLAPIRFIGFLMLVFGAVALVMSAVGMYGVVGHVVAQSTHEFGVRIALGATKSDVIALVAGRAIRTTAAGLVVGGMLAFVLARVAQSMVFGLIVMRLGVFAGFAALLLFVAVFAAMVPARRAAQVDPIVALRQD